MRTTGHAAPTPPHDAPLPREAYTLLAQANLLRMRGRWDEAVEKCMAALRLAPESASAQSLLGDIYENQGRHDDAIQWYRMALDVNPDSPADKLKLARLLEADPRRMTDTPPSGATVVLRASAPARPTRPAPEADRLLRGIAWLAAALFLVASVLGGIVMSRHRIAPSTISAPPVLVSPPVADPALSPSVPDPSSALPSPPSPAGASDPAEASLLQSLQQDSQLSAQNILPVAVQMDPRQNVVTLTVSCPAPPPGASDREALLRAAALAALAGVRAQGDRVPTWTVRCLMPPPGGASDAAPDLALIADTSSPAVSALGGDPGTLPAAQLLSAFRNVWWSPAVPLQ